MQNITFIQKNEKKNERMLAGTKTVTTFVLTTTRAKFHTTYLLGRNSVQVLYKEVFIWFFGVIQGAHSNMSALFFLWKVGKFILIFSKNDLILYLISAFLRLIVSFLSI
jgi:hypothetical protein